MSTESVRNGRIGVAQITSTSNVMQNLESAKLCCKLAQSSNIEMLCFPECVCYIGPDTILIGESIESSTILKNYSLLAIEHNLWLSLGGFPEKCVEKNKVYNTHILMDNHGRVISTYRKVHLFTVAIENGPNLDETIKTEPGSELVLVDTPFGRLGMAICYDLRFPELFGVLRNQGAEILLIPSAFTVETGTAHWHALLRARAIENQCYVIAAAQVGKHNETRSSYGHSLIVDPWGRVLVDCNDKINDVSFVDIDFQLMRTVRTQIPKENHRKDEVYSRCPRLESYK
jgi:predicted amidohydrolase